MWTFSLFGTQHPNLLLCGSCGGSRAYFAQRRQEGGPRADKHTRRPGVLILSEGGRGAGPHLEMICRAGSHEEAWLG